jgi:hypothetical protein
LPAADRQGGLSRLTIIVRLPLSNTSSQIACGAWLRTSFNSGIDTPNGKVMSNLPAENASIWVDTLGMIEYSMPSR